jgi:hypothetical protein
MLKNVNLNLSDRIFGIFWRSLIVGIGYTLASLITESIIPIMGATLPKAHGNVTNWLWIFLLSGILIGLTLGPIATQMTASRSRHFLIWSCAIFFNLVPYIVEGTFFAPDLASAGLSALIIQDIFVALATAALVSVLFAPPGKVQVSSTHLNRPWHAWAWRFVVSSLSYIIFYFIFGAVNYALVTKPYYETHVSGLTVPAPQVVLMVESIRAPLFVLSVLPLMLTMQTTRRRLAIMCGIILFVVGGVVPLLQEVNTLPLFLLVASAWEIFFQNFLTGVVVAVLLGYRQEAVQEKE